jgi:CMP-N,N'-diacetyllegionaminic acid synthase
VSQTIALVPAKSRSTGIPSKNFRMLGEKTLVHHAIDCGRAAGCFTVVSTDDTAHRAEWWMPMVIDRPAELATDSASMLAVVQHALQQLPGAEDDIIVLLQPTQPFRTADHLREAVRLLRETQADSVVSVVELPKTHSLVFQYHISAGQLVHADYEDRMPARRQDAEPVYIRDGTVYAFWRRTVSRAGDIYGCPCLPLIIPPEQSCELDTEDDWQRVEARWKERT